MKQLFIIFITYFFLASTAFGQINIDKQVTNWKLDILKVNDSIFDLNIQTVLKKDWLIYSQFCPVIAGYPFVIVFNYSEFKNITRVGFQTNELNTPLEEFDSISKIVTKYFADTAVFRQRFKMFNKKGRCNLEIQYMTYNNKDKIAYPSETISFKIYYVRKRNTILIKRIN